MNQQKEEIFQTAKRNGVAIINAKDKSDSTKKGIHLLNPTFEELDEAIYLAENKGFDLVVIHNLSTWVDKKSKTSLRLNQK